MAMRREDYERKGPTGRAVPCDEDATWAPADSLEVSCVTNQATEDRAVLLEMHTFVPGAVPWGFLFTRLETLDGLIHDLIEARNAVWPHK